MAVPQEVNLCIRYLQVEFVDAVHNHYVLLGELQTSGLYETEGHKLQADDIVALHLQVAGESHLACTYLYAEFYLRGDETCVLRIVSHLLQECLFLQGVCIDYYCCRSLLDSLTMGAA